MYKYCGTLFFSFLILMIHDNEQSLTSSIRWYITIDQEASDILYKRCPLRPHSPPGDIILIRCSGCALYRKVNYGVEVVVAPLARSCSPP